MHVFLLLCIVIGRKLLLFLTNILLLFVDHCIKFSSGKYCQVGFVIAEYWPRGRGRRLAGSHLFVWRPL